MCNIGFYHLHCLVVCCHSTISLLFYYCFALRSITYCSSSKGQLGRDSGPTIKGKPMMPLLPSVAKSRRSDATCFPPFQRSFAVWTIAKEVVKFHDWDLLNANCTVPVLAAEYLPSLSGRLAAQENYVRKPSVPCSTISPQRSVGISRK